MPHMTISETRAVLDRAEFVHGHVIEDDSPGGLSRVQRWTCGRCGDAILRYGSNVYGSALDTPCAAITTTNGS
jgi:hypothetical protein